MNIWFRINRTFWTVGIGLLFSTQTVLLAQQVNRDTSRRQDAKSERDVRFPTDKPKSNLLMQLTRDTDREKSKKAIAKNPASKRKKENLVGRRSGKAVDSKPVRKSILKPLRKSVLKVPAKAQPDESRAEDKPSEKTLRPTRRVIRNREFHESQAKKANLDIPIKDRLAMEREYSRELMKAEPSKKISDPVFDELESIKNLVVETSAGADEAVSIGEDVADANNEVAEVAMANKDAAREVAANVDDVEFPVSDVSVADIDGSVNVANRGVARYRYIDVPGFNTSHEPEIVQQNVVQPNQQTENPVNDQPRAQAIQHSASATMPDIVHSAKRPSDLLLNKTQRNLAAANQQRQLEQQKRLEHVRQQSTFRSRFDNLQQEQMAAVSRRNERQAIEIRRHLSDMSKDSVRMRAFANQPLNKYIESPTISTTAHQKSGPVYVNLSDSHGGTLALETQQIDSNLANVGDIESETISRSNDSGMSGASSIAPSQLWMNSNSKSNRSQIKTLHSGQATQRAMQKTGKHTGVGLLRPSSQEAENQDVEAVQTESEFPSQESNEGNQSIELQRERYRKDLHRPLSVNPVSRALNYVDDDGNSIPSTEQQRLHLIGFNNFYANEIRSDIFRVNQNGELYLPKCGIWKSPDLCFQPLYFEDVNLERFGARYGWIQPAASAIHFFASTVRLPYKMALDPYWECQYAAGYGRPGNAYCYQRERLTWNLRAGSFQALLATGLVFAIP